MSLCSFLFGEDDNLSNDCLGIGHHNDEIVEKTEMASAYDQMSEKERFELMGGKISPFLASSLIDERPFVKFFQRKVIFTIKCKKCGRVIQEYHVNPE